MRALGAVAVATLALGCSSVEPAMDAGTAEGGARDWGSWDGGASPAGTCFHPAVKPACKEGWCTIPAGCFQMGPSDPQQSGDTRRVSLTRSFQLADTEVTQQQFKAAMGYNPSQHASCGGECPVESVTWHEAAAYCNALSTAKGLTPCYRCSSTSGKPAEVTCSASAAYEMGELDQRLWALWGAASGELWIVGGEGVLRYDKGLFYKDAPSSTPLYAIWGASSKDVWVVGQGGLILRFDGTSWSKVTSPVQTSLLGIWGSSAADIWAVGALGTLIHYDGSAWSLVTTALNSDLRAVWGSSASDVWAAGDDGALMHHDGKAWTSRSASTSWDLYAIWGSSASDVWAVGDSGIAIHFDGASWKARNPPVTRDLRAVWGSASGDVWAAGDLGTLVHHDGKSWKAHASPNTSARLRGLWGRSSSQIWAVGSQGALLRFDGQRWLRMGTIYDCPGYRLPTEAEWEYACRGGTTTWLYNGSVTELGGKDDNAEKIAWYKANAGGKTHPVGKKLQNPWGLYDMVGNTGEYVHDFYTKNLGTSALVDPVVSKSLGDVPVARGGDYVSVPFYLRCATRFYYTPPPDGLNGFRCARTQPPP